MTETQRIVKDPRTTEHGQPRMETASPGRNATERGRMDRLRKHAIAAGVFFLLTDITSIVALLVYEPLTQHADFVTSATANDFPIRLGAFLEILLAVGVIGTALALYPILKKRNQAMALAYVAGRTWEAGLITLGILSLLVVLTLRLGFVPSQDDAATYTAISRSLIALHDWTFLFGPYVVLSLNATILGYLLVSSRLVPRWIGLLALIDGPLLFASSVAMLFGAYAPTSPFAIALALPMLAFEVSVAVWLIVKGFNKPALAALESRAT